MGNSLAAGDVGGELVLDTTQINDGGEVEAIAQFDGTAGYDGQANATAYGNSIGNTPARSAPAADVNNLGRQLQYQALSIVGMTATGRRGSVEYRQHRSPSWSPGSRRLRRGRFRGI